MKFNVVCISVAIGLLASCSQAAPIVNDVGKTVSDVVSANDGPVKAPLDQTTDYAEKVVTDATGDVSGLTKRQDIGGVTGQLSGVTSQIGGVVADLTGTLQNVGKREGSNVVGSTLQTASGLLTGATSGVGLGKRLLDNGGDASTMTSQGGVQDLANSLLGKRQALGGVGNLGGAVTGLTSSLGLDSTLEGVGVNQVLGKRDAVAGLTAPVTSTLSGLNVDQTLAGVTDVSKLAGSLPLDTTTITNLAGVKRGKKADTDDDDKKTDKDDDKKTKDDDKKTKDDDKKTDDDDKKTKDDKKAKTDNGDQPKQEGDDQPKQEGDDQPKQEEGDAN